MIAALLLVAVWLLLALIIRACVPGFAAARIPASLIGGVIGLGCLQLLTWLTQDPAVGSTRAALAAVTQDWVFTLRSWPGVLIAVVFAGLLLTKSPARGKTDLVPARTTDLRRVGREGVMVWIIALGQTAVGLWITWLFIQPLYALPNSAGMLIETGFAGGHGTAAAMGTVFSHGTIDFREGLDLGLLMATAGLAWGLVSGIAWINLALARRWYVLPRTDDASEARDKVTAGGSISVPHRAASHGPPLGDPRVDGNVLDPLLLQFVWLLLALGIGLALQQLVSWGGSGFDQLLDLDNVSSSHDGGNDGSSAALKERLTTAGVLGSFPLFIYTLFGGAVVRGILQLVGQTQLIDAHTIARLVATAMDILVVAAVATLDVSAVASLWVPFLSLFIGGAVWSSFCLLVLSPRILPADMWFPLGLINYGMSTGTTATGFVLLRVVDPHLKSGAGETYALAAPLSAPFVGGGMLTIALPLLVLQRVPIWASTLSVTAVVVVLVLIGMRPSKNRREG